MEKIEEAKMAYPLLDQAVAEYAKKFGKSKGGPGRDRAEENLGKGFFCRADRLRMERRSEAICSMRAGWSPKRAAW